MKSFLILIICAWSNLTAMAQGFTVNASYQGAYSSLGASGTANYIAGDSAGYGLRDYFVFDLSGLPVGTVSSATLNIYNPGASAGDLYNGFGSPNRTETYQVGSVSTPISTLALAHSYPPGAVAVFNNLASGTLWGSRLVSSNDNGTLVDVQLNASFLTAASLDLGGGAIAIGGYLAGDTGFTQNRYIFGYTGDAIPQLSLRIVPVPEPSSLAMGFCFAMLLISKRAREESHVPDGRDRLMLVPSGLFWGPPAPIRLG
jgi:hypothetical protein